LNNVFFHKMLKNGFTGLIVVHFLFIIESGLIFLFQ